VAVSHTRTHHRRWVAHTHTHTHIPIHARTHTRTHTHAHAHTHTHTHTRSLALSLSLSFFLTHTYIHSLSHTPRCAAHARRRRLRHTQWRNSGRVRLQQARATEARTRSPPLGGRVCGSSALLSNEKKKQKDSVVNEPKKNSTFFPCGGLRGRRQLHLGCWECRDRPRSRRWPGVDPLVARARQTMPAFAFDVRRPLPSKEGPLVEKLPDGTHRDVQLRCVRAHPSPADG